MLEKSVAVGAVCKGNVQHLGVGHGLLQAMGYCVIIVLRFHDGNGMVWIQIEDIICFLRFFTHSKIAPEVYFPIRDFGFHGDAVYCPLVQ